MSTKHSPMLVVLVVFAALSAVVGVRPGGAQAKLCYFRDVESSFDVMTAYWYVGQETCCQKCGGDGEQCDGALGETAIGLWLDTFGGESLHLCGVGFGYCSGHFQCTSFPKGEHSIIYRYPATGPFDLCPACDSSSASCTDPTPVCDVWFDHEPSIDVQTDLDTFGRVVADIKYRFYQTTVGGRLIEVYWVRGGTPDPSPIKAFTYWSHNLWYEGFLDDVTVAVPPGDVDGILFKAIACGDEE